MSSVNITFPVSASIPFCGFPSPCVLYCVRTTHRRVAEPRESHLCLVQEHFEAAEQTVTAIRGIFKWRITSGAKSHVI